MTGDRTRDQQRSVAAYVWRRWAAGYDSHLVGMARAAGLACVGRQISDIAWCLTQEGVLKEHVRPDGLCVGYAPGPRFGGLDRAGRVYQVVA